jgi:hypothetical protein
MTLLRCKSQDSSMLPLSTAVCLDGKNLDFSVYMCENTSVLEFRERANDPDLLHTPLLIHEGNALLILCRSKGQELILLDAASPGQYVMVIALDALEEEMRKSLARSR